eukprot:TRINITY_DN8397_c0_g2_i1.p1 TRINITY_DN8397_c0_g2~~TRINITY_DN8397_c0_g2_i1.p1  ORF type:complete len:282 (+),score=87.82 TRINITY_DN8397_c0_g2_i1:166-1011(+)
MTSKELQDFINFLDIEGQDANQVAVETWLRLIGYGEYVDGFLSHGYDSLAVFPNLSDKDLELAGVRREDRRRLLMHNSKLRTNTGAIMDNLMKELAALSEAQADKEAKKEASLLNLANLALQAKDDGGQLSQRSAGASSSPASRRMSVSGYYASGERKVAATYAQGVPCRFAPRSEQCTMTSCAMSCLHCKKGYCGACLYGEGGKMKSIHQCSVCGKSPRSLPSFSHRPVLPGSQLLAPAPAAAALQRRRSSWSEPVDNRAQLAELAETQNKYRSMVAMDL